MICAPRYSFYHYFCKTKFIKWELPLYDLCSAAQFLLLLLQNKIHKVEMATFATAAHTPVFTIQLDRSASLCCQLLPDFVSLACCSAHRGRLEVCSRRGIEHGSKATQNRSHDKLEWSCWCCRVQPRSCKDTSKSEARAQWAQQCSSICLLRSKCMGTQPWPNRCIYDMYNILVYRER